MLLLTKGQSLSISDRHCPNTGNARRRAGDRCVRRNRNDTQPSPTQVSVGEIQPRRARTHRADDWLLYVNVDVEAEA